MKTLTNEQCQQVAAKLLPEKVFFGKYIHDDWSEDADSADDLRWIGDSMKEPETISVPNSAMLDICHQIEENLTPEQWKKYSDLLMVTIRDSDPSVNGWNLEARYKTPHATWQQRLTALAFVKGIEL